MAKKEKTLPWAFLDEFRGKSFTGEWPTLPEMFSITVSRYPNNSCFTDFEPEKVTLTYTEVLANVKKLSNWILTQGLKKGDRVAVSGKNSPEWATVYLATLFAGGIIVPIDYGLHDKEISNLLNAAKPNLFFVDEEKFGYFSENPQGTKVYSLSKKHPELYAYNLSDEKEYTAELPTEDDVAAILFTSGTTGKPKGVQLSHGNFLTQLEELPERIYVNPGDRALSVLPIWHVFERAVEYVIMIQAGVICYSKPIGSVLLSDFLKLNPVLLPAVPRVFEAIYDGVQRKMRKTGGIVFALFSFFVAVAKIHSRMHRKMFRKNPCFSRYYTGAWWVLCFIPWLLLWPLKFLGNIIVFRKIKAMLGKNFRAGVAGGGAFPPSIDEFFWAIGVKVVEGYGLTETAPVISVRPIAAPVFGNVGSPIRGVKARIVDPDGYVLGRCKFGSIQIQGGTVMKGYYKAPELTEKVMTVDGWLDTGDLGMLTIHDEIVIKGRKKDTIVLRGGENIEPLPIEMKLSESRYIKTSVIVGQDQRYLAALILVDEEEIKNYAAENGIHYDTYENLLASQEIQTLYDTEINSLISSKNGFKMFERVNKFTLIQKPFEVGVELSAKQEIMRFRISEIYAKEIKAMFTEN